MDATLRGTARRGLQTTNISTGGRPERPAPADGQFAAAFAVALHAPTAYNTKGTKGTKAAKEGTKGVPLRRVAPRFARFGRTTYRGRK